MPSTPETKSLFSAGCRGSRQSETLATRCKRLTTHVEADAEMSRDAGSIPAASTESFSRLKLLRATSALLQASLFNISLRRKDFSAHSLGEALGRKVPIDVSPKAFHVLSAIVSIVDVVCVFPDVDCQDRLQTIFQRCVSVAEGHDF